MAAKTEAMVDVGRRLRRLRERAGMPKEQVALALKMSAGNWAHYESGRNQLAATMLPTLADLFRITVPELANLLFSASGDEDTLGHLDSWTLEMKHSKYLALYLDCLAADPLRTAHAPIRELAYAGA